MQQSPIDYPRIIIIPYSIKIVNDRTRFLKVGYFIRCMNWFTNFLILNFNFPRSYIMRNIPNESDITSRDLQFVTWIIYEEYRNVERKILILFKDLPN